jgi:dipeptidyl aminopeptidase/acylaminoacyl peptidase
VSTSGSPHPAPLTGGDGLFNPSVSPSGHEIAAVRGTTEHGSSLVIFQPASGTVTSTLIHTPRFFGEPAWSPDGKRIAVEKQSSEVSAILVVPAKGGTAVTATHGENPVWEAPRTIWFAKPSPSGAGDLRSTTLAKASKQWRKPVNRTRTAHRSEADPSFGPLAS